MANQEIEKGFLLDDEDEKCLLEEETIFIREINFQPQEITMGKVQPLINY